MIGVKGLLLIGIFTLFQLSMSNVEAACSKPQQRYRMIAKPISYKNNYPKHRACNKATCFKRSYVADEWSDDPAASWPSRRDGNFSDMLAR